MGRLLGFSGVIVVMGLALFFYSKQIQSMPGSTDGSNPESAALITGVKNDLIGIANAERGFLAQQGKYGSLDELVSGNYITIKGQRPPYSYDVQTTSGGFRITATRSTPGTPARLWIDETMEIQTGN